MEYSKAMLNYIGDATSCFRPFWVWCVKHCFTTGFA